MTFILFGFRLFKAGLPIYDSTVTVNNIGDIWPFNFRKKDFIKIHLKMRFVSFGTPQS